MAADDEAPEQDPARPRSDFASEKDRRGFIRMLNAKLPTKRLIAQGVLRDGGGRVLLCQLTYKKDWDLPGGVVDPGESPAGCLRREIREELGLEIEVGELLGVNWLPPYRGWDDALLCLFDLGEVDAALTETLTLQRREIKAVHWAGIEQVAAHTAPYTARMLAEVAMGLATGTAYLENSSPNEGGPRADAGTEAPGN